MQYADMRRVAFPQLSKKRHVFPHIGFLFKGAKMFTVSREEIVEKIKAAAASGKIFRVNVIKRSTGTKRRFVCRGRVKPPESSGRRTMNPADHDLITICDMNARSEQDSGFRNIAIEGILNAKIAGTEFVVE